MQHFDFSANLLHKGLVFCTSVTCTATGQKSIISKSSVHMGTETIGKIELLDLVNVDPIRIAYFWSSGEGQVESDYGVRVAATD